MVKKKHIFVCAEMKARLEVVMIQFRVPRETPQRAASRVSRVTCANEVKTNYERYGNRVVGRMSRVLIVSPSLSYEMLIRVLI